MNTLAIDIGGTKISAALISRDNQLTQHTQITTPASASPTLLYEALVAITTPLKADANSIAVASTGIISDGVLTALNPDNLGGLKDFPLKETLSKLTGLPCQLLNDGQAAAWAEYDYRRESIADMAFITVSTGVGGGLIQQGQLLTGKRGIAGHLGHTLADPHGPLCGCGRYGCVEAIASGRAIAAQAVDELAGKDAKAIFTAFYQGNVQAKAIIERSANTIANLVTDIKATTDVDCVVLGGSVGLAKGYIELVQAAITPQPLALQVPVLSAYYHHNAGLWGATLWARE
ncbi:N-acetylmannosamine kinase [Moellerella wisconsensis]|uniref:N-acetylmannosamine kinase n=1 Tax=Moellerella wisconsensis TaxID=158849 RepID=UPI00240EC057|nr:N-acetylmannosamine kinase [Moellerella wisconsensis]